MRRQIAASLAMLLGVTLLLGFGYPLAVTGIAQLFFRDQANGSLLYSHGKLVGSALLGQGFSDSKGNPLPRYFQPRPSAAGTGYDGTLSGASNLGPSSPLLIGFIAGVNTVGLDGRPSASNPFATAADPACVPLDPGGKPVTSPARGQKFAKTAAGAYECDPSTIPERAVAFRLFNDMASSAGVPVDAVTASASGLDPGISAASALDQAPRVARSRHLPDSRVITLIRQYTTAPQWGFASESTVNVLKLNLALDGLR